MRHELHLARSGFAALAVVAVASASVSGLLVGPAAARSAVLAVAVVAVNHGLAVLSTAWSRVLSPRVVAVGYAGFFLRMLVLLPVFVLIASVGWLDRPVFAMTLGAALALSLAAECVSYARGSYVPSWRRRQTPLIPLRRRLVKETG